MSDRSGDSRERNYQRIGFKEENEHEHEENA